MDKLKIKQTQIFLNFELKYLKPMLEELEAKEMNLYDVCYELSQEVEQLKEIIQQEI